MRNGSDWFGWFRGNNNQADKRKNVPILIIFLRRSCCWMRLRNCINEQIYSYIDNFIERELMIRQCHMPPRKLRE